MSGPWNVFPAVLEIAEMKFRSELNELIVFIMFSRPWPTVVM